LNQVVRGILKRLKPFAQVVHSGEFNRADIRTWPLVLIKLDRHLESRLSGRHITMVAHLLGREAPLARPELRKGLGKHLLARLEENLKAHSLVEDLAWRIRIPADPRRAFQDEIERRIHELNTGPRKARTAERGAHRPSLKSLS
jgi:hypothetical protein